MPLAATISFGKHGIWPNTTNDLGGADDGTLIWWNPTAKGKTEKLYQLDDAGTFVMRVQETENSDVKLVGGGVAAYMLTEIT